MVYARTRTWLAMTVNKCANIICTFKPLVRTQLV